MLAGHSKDRKPIYGQAVLLAWAMARLSIDGIASDCPAVARDPREERSGLARASSRRDQMGGCPTSARKRQLTDFIATMRKEHPS
jgi:hypothetical protein